MKQIILIVILALFPILSVQKETKIPFILIPKTYHRHDTVTAYCYNPDIGAITADGTIIEKQRRWIAISRDLVEFYPFNSIVSISGTHTYDGKWIVKDLMAEEHKKSIDFMLVDTTKKINSWKSIKIKKYIQKKV